MRWSAELNETGVGKSFCQIPTCSDLRILVLKAGKQGEDFRIQITANNVRYDSSFSDDTIVWLLSCRENSLGSHLKTMVYIVLLKRVDGS